MNIPEPDYPRYKVIACHVLWRELCYYGAQGPAVLDFHFIKQGLHDTPDILREELQKAIDAVEGNWDAILIGYGLCSNGLVGITARDIPLVIMRGHDCLTFLLGSKEKYQEYFDANPGTYWYSPGWIDVTSMPGPERLKKIKEVYTEKYGADNAGYLIEMEQDWINKYTNAVYVDLGTGDTDKYRDYTKACAEFLDWKFDEIKGEPQLIKDFLHGNWDNKEAFLRVEPGESIAASHNETIIKVKS